MIPTRSVLGAAGAVWLAFVLAGGSAWAQAEMVPISYQADGSCPAADVFLAAVREKTPNVALAPAGAPASYAVNASAGAGQSFARLTMRGADGTTTTRDLAGASCEEVVRAIALTTSLAITQEKEQRSAIPAAGPPPPPTPPRAPPEGSRSRMAVGAGASVLGGIAPRVAFAESVFLQGDLPASTWPASLRLGVLYANPATSNDPSWGTARFQAMIAGLEACPYRVEAGHMFRLLPSARLEGGFYLASGDVTAPGGRSSTFSGAFGSLAPLVRGQVLIGDVLLLEAEVGLRFLLSRYSFEIQTAPGSTEPARAVYDMPAVAGFGGLGLGFQFF